MPLPAAVLKARNASRRRRERQVRAEDRLMQIQTIETMQRVFQKKGKKGPTDKGLLVQKYASKWVKKLSPGKTKGSDECAKGDASSEDGSGREIHAGDTAAAAVSATPIITRAATMHNLSTTATAKLVDRRKSLGRLENMKRLRALRRRRSAGRIDIGTVDRKPPAARAPQTPPARRLSQSRSMSVGLHFDAATSLESIVTNRNYRLEMLPHQHTLKCDRRERVCTIKGPTEREIVVLRVPASKSPIREIAWFTVLLLTGSGRLQNQRPVGTGGHEYRLQLRDVGRHITAVVTLESGARVRSTLIGPIVPGPASIDSIVVEMTPGTENCCVCKADYWGGLEGDSTYRWIAVRSDGSRRTLVEERVCDAYQFGRLDPLAPNRDDPRFYFLKEADRGSKIKVSYRPIRQDGWRGELKTSKALQV